VAFDDDFTGIDRDRLNRRQGLGMSGDHSVTRWIEGLKSGDSDDIERLWHRYFRRLMRLAGAKLPGHCRRAFDEEDVALSAFHSFCDRAARGQFPQLSDRGDLWRLLAVLTVRKAIMRMRYQTRQKRGGGQTTGESGLQAADHSGVDGLPEFLAREPTPEDAAQFSDACDYLFDRLDEPILKTIALRKLHGYTNEEIAHELGVTSRTIDRKLRLIRAVWEEGVAV
jgi:DNA-directed RNA polymerase specialized sigma24 family protein